MIPNFKTDLKEFVKTMLQIACILMVFFAIVYFLLAIIPSPRETIGENEYVATTSELLQP